MKKLLKKQELMWIYSKVVNIDFYHHFLQQYPLHCKIKKRNLWNGQIRYCDTYKEQRNLGEFPGISQT